MAKAAPKLSGQQKALVVKLLGAYFTVTETLEILLKDYDIELTYAAVYWYWKHHQDEIKQQRNLFDDKVEVLPITDKIYRLYQRQYLIDDLRKHLWYEKPLLRHGKPVADKDGKPIVLKLTGNHESINKILDSAQKELEPQKRDHGGEIRMSDDERLERITAIFDRARQRRAESTNGNR